MAGSSTSGSRLRRGGRTLAVVAWLAAPAVAAAVPTVVSVATGGAQGSAPASTAGISADGRFVLFWSSDPLAGPATGGVRQLYLRDTQLGTTTLASATADGRPSDRPVLAAALSGDGRYAVFATAATNLSGEVDGDAVDVFRKDVAGGAVALVSVDPAGGPANAGVEGSPDVSHDGSRIAYLTGPATNLWAGDPGIASDLIVRDLRAGTTIPVSVTQTGLPLGGPIGVPAIAATGRRVAFTHASTLSVRDLAVGTLTSIDTAAGATAAPDISGSGARVAYVSGGAVRTAPVGGSPTTLASGSQVRISADGTRVAYVDGSGRLRTQPTSGAAAQDLVTPSHLPSAPQFAGNGSAVAFDLDDGPSPSASPAAGDTDLAPDVLRETRPATDVTGPSLSAVASDPVPGAATATVTGTVGDPSGVVSLTVSGATARLDESGEFAVTLPVPQGESALSVVGRDAAGNSTTLVLGVRRAAPASPPTGPTLDLVVRKVVLTSSRRRGVCVGITLRGTPTLVTVRVFQRVRRSGRTVDQSVGAAVRGRARAGAQTLRLRTKALPRGEYRVRVTMVGPAGAVVRTTRHVVG